MSEARQISTELKALLKVVGDYVYKYCACMYIMYTMCIPGSSGNEKRASDLLTLELTDSCEPLCGC